MTTTPASWNDSSALPPRPDRPEVSTLTKPSPIAQGAEGAQRRRPLITVVHVITKLELGGAQENTLYTCEHLDRSRFRVSLVHGPGGLLTDEARRLPDTEVRVVPSLVREPSPYQDAVCFLALKRLFRELWDRHQDLGHPSLTFVVHTHSSKAGIIGRLAARAAGIPTIVHSIHGFGFHAGQSLIRRNALIQSERIAGRVTDAFIGVSAANLAEGRALGFIRGGHEVRLIRSGINLGLFQGLESRRESNRKALGFKGDQELILSIGNFKPQKDPLTMLGAMARLAATRPQAILLLVGDGPLRGAVEERIRVLGLGSRVRILGWRRDVPELLAACDVVALSSIFEGLPRAAVQALAAQRPFVGTRVDGTPEIIRDGKNGFLVEPESPDELAAALERALEERPIDPEDAIRVQEWGTQRMVEAQEGLYEKLVHRAHFDDSLAHWRNPDRSPA